MNYLLNPDSKYHVLLILFTAGIYVTLNLESKLYVKFL